MLSAEGGSCDAACAGMGGQCDISSTLSITGSYAGVTSAAAAVGRTCNGMQYWSYDSGPGLCTSADCCQGSCVNVCVVGSTPVTSCTSSSPQYSRLCSCLGAPPSSPPPAVARIHETFLSSADMAQLRGSMVAVSLEYANGVVNVRAGGLTLHDGVVLEGLDSTNAASWCELTHLT